jgi:hypothetical protein
MHNNGTTPQLILPERRLLPDLQPQGGFRIQLTPQGIVLSPYIGEQSMDLCLDPASCTQLGVNLISAAAVLQKIAADAKPDPVIKLTDN